MVTDAILSPLLGLVEWVLALLPSAPVTVPGAGPMLLWVGRVDSLVPIAEALTFAAGLGAVAIVFVVVRLVLTVWNLVWP